MKVRTDFVTNSSSSSFILGFKDAEQVEEVLNREIDDRRKEYRDELLEEIPRKTRTKESILSEYSEDVRWELLWACDDFFEGKRGDMLRHEFRETKEYKDKLTEMTQDYVDKLKAKMEGCKFFAVVNHGDGGEGEDGVLEHEILPQLSCTIKRISHH